MTQLIKVNTNQKTAFEEVRRIASLVVGFEVEKDREIVDGVRFELIHPRERWPNHTMLGISLGVDDANYKMHYQRVMVLPAHRSPTRDSVIDLDKLKTKFEGQKKLAKRFAEDKITKEKQKEEAESSSAQVGKKLGQPVYPPNAYLPLRDGKNITGHYLLLISFKDDKELLGKLQSLVGKLLEMR